MMETILFVLAMLGIALLQGVSYGPALASASIAVLLAAAALAFRLRGNGARARELGMKAAAFAVLVGALFALKTINRGIAARGTEQLTSACEAYKSRTGSYPASLDLLVPGEISSLPRAGLSLSWGRYLLRDGRIFHVTEPGLMAGSYDLAGKSWKSVRFSEMFPGY